MGATADYMRKLRHLLPTALLVLAMLACQLGGTPVPPASTPTHVPLPTAVVPTLVSPTPIGLAPTATPPAPDATAIGSGLGAIGGWVWHDLCDPGSDGQPAPVSPPPGCVTDQFGGYRADGVREANEPVLAGVVVRLGVGACPSTGLAESSTAAAGPSYAFTGLQAGAYCVSVDPFAEPNLSLLLPGNWTYPGRADGLLSQTISVAPGQSQLDISFGWDYQFLPVSGGPAGGACTYLASLVADVSVPANTVFSPGTAFVKTWRVRNDGTCTWGRPEDALRFLAFVSGTRLGAPETVPIPVNIPPGFTTDISVNFTAPAGPGTYLSEWKLQAEPNTLVGVGPGGADPLSVQIVVEAASALSRPGQRFHAVRLAAPPTIDGSLNEWTVLPFTLNTAAYRPENWTGVNDQSANFALAWDSTYLYLAVRLVDDVHVQTQTGETIFRGDSLEVLLDADLSGDFDSAELNGDDYQLGLTPGANKLTPDAFLWFPAPNRGRPAGVVVATSADSAGFFLEAAIPWAVFNLAPAAGSHFGFALSASDNDTPGAAEQQSMISTEAGRRLSDPTTWGTLILDP